MISLEFIREYVKDGIRHEEFDSLSLTYTGDKCVWTRVNEGEFWTFGASEQPSPVVVRGHHIYNRNEKRYADYISFKREEKLKRINGDV